MRSPKYHKALRALTVFAGFSCPWAPSLLAADVFKANNIDALNLASSWEGGQLPLAADTVVWDSRVNQGGSLIELGGSATWGSLKVENNVNELAVYDGSATLSLTLGGVNMSGATSGNTFVIYGPVINGVAGKQSWSVADGATLFASAAPVLPAGATIDYNLGATGAGNFVWSTGSTSSFQHYRTVNGGRDFVGFVTNPVTVLGSPQDNAVKVVSGVAAGRATASPSDGGDPAVAATLTTFPNDGYVDVTNSNGLATVTAFQITNANLFPTNSGIRFGQSHATAGTDWIVTFGGTNSRIQPNSPFAILVSPEVGDRDVVFQNSGSGHEFRYNNSGGRLVFQQHNTAGDLIWRGDITKAAGAASSNATGIVKAGPGRLIFANASYANGTGNAPIHVNEGTFQLGEGGTAGTLDHAPIVNNGAFVVNKSNDYVHNGVISGTGSLAINSVGSASVTLGGANTYTGATALNSGTVVLANATALGASSSVTLAGANLRFDAALDPSAHGPVNLAASTTLDTNARDISFANSITGSGGLTKVGAGKLSLGGANTYAGDTTITVGELAVTNTSGSATGSGAVSLATGTLLSGSGAIAGSVTTSAGTKILPGSGVGTLTTGGLTLASGSLLDWEFASTSSYDKVVVTGSNGLTINGGGIQLLGAGTSDAYATAGLYNLFQYSGSILGSGPSALSVLNPQAGYSYTFAANGGFLTLEIVQDAILSQWNMTGPGSWGSSGNWSNGVPASGYTAQFTTSLASPATVTLDGDRTVNGMVFNSAQGYTIAAGTGGSLTFFKSGSAAAINIVTGDHVISAPVNLSSSIAVTSDADASLTITGQISGAGGISKAGDGLLDITGDNTFSGDVSIVGGVLAFSQASSLGSGALSINGGTLAYNAGNTTDISVKTIAFGLDGAVIDTNGNDVTFANSIGNGGLGSFSKSGEGSLTLLAASTYTGETFVNGGELIIPSNAALGDAATGATLNLDGGIVVPNISMTLDNAGANARAVVVGENGGGFLTAEGIDLIVPGAMSGSGVFTKSGSGSLTLTANNGARTGATVVEGGVIGLGSDRAVGQTGLGTGKITFTGDSDFRLNGAGANDNGTTFGFLSNAIEVAPGATVEFRNPSRGGYTGVLSGVPSTVGELTTYSSGTVNYHVDGNRFETSGVWPNFNGTFGIHKTPTGDGADTDEYRLNDVGHDLSAAKVHVNAGVRMLQSVNPPNNVTGRTHQFGEITVDAGAYLAGNLVSGRYNIYQIGALNTDSVINGQIEGAVGGNWGIGFPRLIKVGTGRLTLNNDHMFTSGASTVSVEVNGGTLDVRGSIADFYINAGANGTIGNSDDTLSLTQPTGEGVVSQLVAPGSLVVAAGATLAGNGTLGGAITVNGALRPDETGAIGGQLKLTGSGSLALAATAITQFDFGGANFTGVKSTSTGAVTYGGALKLNFLGTVFSGSYQLFELAVAPTGAFTGVSVTTAVDAETALTDSGSGVWSGTVGAQSYSFNAATGVLTVTGGATAVTPGASTLGATAGDGQVDLSWTSAANADSYTVKRATTSGGPYTNVVSNLVGTSYSDTGLTNDTTYFYVVQATNSTSGLSGADSNEVSATPVASVTHTGLQNWRFEEFGVYDDTDAVLAGDTEDFDGDGLANLLEYAVNTDPTVPNASPVVVAKSGNFLTLTYPRRAEADAALTYTVQGSASLTTGFTAATGGTNTVGSTSTYTDDVNVGATGVRRFLRLSVTYTAP